jgi:hypothetical protein
MIEGKVTNQYGEPVENVLLIVFQLTTFEGGLSPTRVGTLWTDDRGLYRLTRVQPGEYYVKALGRNGGTETHVGPGVAGDASWESFVPVYHDGSSVLSSATPVHVVTGSRVRADFNLPLQRAFRIQGQLEGYKGSESVTFELLRGDEQVVPNRALLDGTTGRFEVLDVVPGAYTLLAAQGNTRGEIVVNVASADVGGTSITLTSPNVIHGSIHTIKSPTASSGSGEGYGADPADRCNVSLKDGRLQPGVDTPPYGRGSGDNQFDIENVYPGKYRVEFHCTGGYPVSASFGVVDLLANPIVTISAATARLPIEILFRPGGGTSRVWRRPRDRSWWCRSFHHRLVLNGICYAQPAVTPAREKQFLRILRRAITWLTGSRPQMSSFGILRFFSLSPAGQAFTSKMARPPRSQ